MSKLFDAIKELEKNKGTEQIKPSFKPKNAKKKKFYLLWCFLILGCVTIMAGVLYSSNWNNKKIERKFAKQIELKTKKEAVNKNKLPQKETELKNNQTPKSNLSQEKQKYFKKEDLNKNTPKIKDKKRIPSEERKNKIRKNLVNNKESKNTKKLEENKKPENNINQNLLIAEEYRKKGFYEKALEFYQKALTEENKNKKTYILNNIGAIYLIENKPKLAIKYLNKAYHLKKERITLQNIIIAYIQMGKINEACKFASKEGLKEIEAELGCH